MAKEKNQELTKISLHSLKNILGHQYQTSLFSHHDQEFSKEFGITMTNAIHRFGIELTDIQLRVVEGILKGLSDTSYAGNIDPRNTEEVSKEKYSGKLPDTYKYISEIPRLRATQSQIFEWMDINRNSISTRMRVLEALRELGTMQFCFYYDRLAFSTDGVPQKHDDGKWKKEQVVAVDTLFTIKEIEKKDSEILDYYEITPSSIFLDQIDGFFILIPYRWRDEVKKVVGNKKISSYTFIFLIFLRYQYELKRRSGREHECCHIQWTPEEIAIAIKMPGSIYNRKKKRMHSILDEAYFIAAQLGYLSSYERKGYIDILILNRDKYSLLSSDCADVNCKNTQDKMASLLMDLFIECRRSLDVHFEISGQTDKVGYIKELNTILKERSFEDINSLIKWSVTHAFWSSRLSTPTKLRQYFSEAWIEFLLSKKTSKLDLEIQHQKFAAEKLGVLHQHFENARFCRVDEARLTLLKNGVEIICGNLFHFIEYKDLHFREKLREMLGRYNFSDIELW